MSTSYLTVVSSTLDNRQTGAHGNLRFHRANNISIGGPVVGNCNAILVHLYFQRLLEVQLSVNRLIQVKKELQPLLHYVNVIENFSNGVQ